MLQKPNEWYEISSIWYPSHKENYPVITLKINKSKPHRLWMREKCKKLSIPTYERTFKLNAEDLNGKVLYSNDLIETVSTCLQSGISKNQKIDTTKRFQDILTE